MKKGKAVGVEPSEFLTEGGGGGGGEEVLEWITEIFNKVLTGENTISVGKGVVTALYKGRRKQGNNS